MGVKAMDFESQQVGAVAVFKPKGPVTGKDADQLKGLLLEAIESNLGRVVVDASDIAFVDSRGLEVFVEVSDELGHGGRALKLSNVSETLREVLAVTDLLPTFEHFEDVNSAVRSFL